MRRALILLICLFPLACDDDDGNGITGPEPGTRLVLSPVQIDAAVGTEFTQTVTLENSVDVFGLTFDVVFDTMVVSFVEDSVEFGDLFGEDALTMSVAEGGRVSLGVSLAQTPDVDQVAGSGEVANLSFTVVGTRESEISLQSVVAIDEAGEPVLVAVSDPTTVRATMQPWCVLKRLSRREGSMLQRSSGWKSRPGRRRSAG